MNRKRIFFSLIVASLLATLTTITRAQSSAQPMRAQTNAEPQWLLIQVVHVRPEMLTEFLDFVKNEANPALQKGGVKQRHVWETATFGEAFEYVAVTPIESLAQLDGDNPIDKALGKEGAAAYRAKARRLIASSHSYAVQYRPDLSLEQQMAGPPKLAVVTSVHIAPGRNQEFENLIKTDVLPTVKKAGLSNYWVHQTSLGGDANEYVIVAPQDSFAEIGKGHPFVRALGQEGAAKLFQKTAGIIMHTERSIARYNPELSFSPPAPAK
jgi:hypothetical protein